MDLLDECHNSYYESPDFTGVYDEGTTLKKLFNVFSFRPIYINIFPKIYQPNYSFVTTQPIYQSLSGTRQQTIPMISIRVPMMTKNNYQASEGFGLRKIQQEEPTEEETLKLE